MADERTSGRELIDIAVEWLVALDSGSADRTAFETWRAADPRHAAAFAQAAAVWRKTADPRLKPMTGAPDPAASSIADVPAPEMPDRARPRQAAPAEAPSRISRRAMVAGVAALAVGAAGGFALWPRRSLAATGVGERRTVPLPDGSTALLNTDTRVAWRFEGARDFWVERGEAALLIRDHGSPFRVHSDPFDARLTSGRLTVRLSPTGGRLLLLSGQAAVTSRGDFAQTLGAGTALIVGGNAVRVVPQSAAAIDGATAWEQGDILFDGMPLDRAIAEFNRYLPQKLALGDPGLGTIRLGGRFHTADLDGFLGALHQGFGIDARRTGDKILLFRQ